MGVLVVKRYRTKLVAKLADLTYVECGTGGRAAMRARVEATRERRYLDSVLAIYRRAGSAAARLASGLSSPDLEEFQLELFAHQVDYRLGSKVGKALTRDLGYIRR